MIWSDLSTKMFTMFETFIMLKIMKFFEIYENSEFLKISKSSGNCRYFLAIHGKLSVIHCNLSHRVCKITVREFIFFLFWKLWKLRWFWLSKNFRSFLKFWLFYDTFWLFMVTYSFELVQFLKVNRPKFQNVENCENYSNFEYRKISNFFEILGILW